MSTKEVLTSEIKALREAKCCQANPDRNARREAKKAALEAKKTMSVEEYSKHLKQERKAKKAAKKEIVKQIEEKKAIKKTL
jgi:hypothetical protein